MSKYCIHHQFHSVGHGTFFTGTIFGTDNIFRWVYDCGSKASTRIRDRITDLSASYFWPKGTTIDLVIISHFDNDHVNGLEQLLGCYRVKWLVLPYLSMQQRLAHAASLGEEDVSSASTAGFAFDPLRWMAMRGMSERVDGVVLMKGGGRNNGALEVGEVLPETPDQDTESVEEDPGVYQFNERAVNTVPRVLLRNHQMPIIARRGLPMEFVFFNTAPPISRVNRSRQSIQQVAKEAADILDRFAVLNPGGPTGKEWRAKLRACYDRHFGKSGYARNNISLCTLARPLAEGQQCNSRIINRLLMKEFGKYMRTKIKGRTQALLLTGDLTLDAVTIDEMKKHFSNWRWHQLRVVQVPHHGSRHSWITGNAAQFPNPIFVHCVPSYSSRSSHPHSIVKADLLSSRVLCANDDVAVV